MQDFLFACLPSLLSMCLFDRHARNIPIGPRMKLQRQSIVQAAITEKKHAIIYQDSVGVEFYCKACKIPRPMTIVVQRRNPKSLEFFRVYTKLAEIALLALNCLTTAKQVTSSEA